MIADIDTRYITDQRPNDVSELVIAIIANQHIIQVDDDGLKYIQYSVSNHGSTNDKELFKFANFLPTNTQKQYCTTIKVDGSVAYDVYLKLFTERSYILVENKIYDGYTIKKIIQTYSQPNNGISLYKTLYHRLTDHRIIFENGGGCTQLIDYIHNKESEIGLSGIKHNRICVIEDSDSKRPGDLEEVKIKCAKFFLGKKPTDNFDIKEIYTIEQPSYIFHLWYKRELENYFSDKAYNKINANPKNLSKDSQIRDYQDIEHTVINYTKSKLPQLPRHMTHRDYEAISKSYPRHDATCTLSEIDLVIHKLFKLI